MMNDGINAINATIINSIMYGNAHIKRNMKKTTFLKKMSFPVKFQNIITPRRLP